MDIRDIEVSLVKWQRTFPWLDKASLRLVQRRLDRAIIRVHHLYPIMDDLPEALREEYLKPPANLEEQTSEVLADIVVNLIYPGEVLPAIISQAAGEIDEAYRVIMQEGGGWSRQTSNPDKRKAAVLDWYQRNHHRLLYLREPYLQDPALYEDRGGQEKRDFESRLLAKVVATLTRKRLPFSKIQTHLKSLKKRMQALRQE
jgi:hypothetical protein